MLRLLLTMAACTVVGALPAIVPAALGQTQTAPTATEKPALDAPTPISYACANEQTFLVVYRSGEEADLMLGTRTFTLKQVPTGSGFKYADGTLTLSGKGEEATLEGAPGGTLRSCIAKTRR